MRVNGIELLFIRDKKALNFTQKWHKQVYRFISPILTVFNFIKKIVKHNDINHTYLIDYQNRSKGFKNSNFPHQNSIFRKTNRIVYGCFKLNYLLKY